MEKLYQFAGLEFAVDLPEEKTPEKEGALQPFSVASVSDPHRFAYQLTEALDPPQGSCIYNDNGLRVYRTDFGQVRYTGAVRDDWRTAYMRIQYCGKCHSVQLRKDAFPDRIGLKPILTAMAVEHLVARINGFVLHCSYIEHEGKAVLFTAPSGTGKSTQAELWHSLRSKRIINGDRSVVRVKDGEVLAEGIPFSGSSQICENCSLPLKAIVYLSQAPETTICPLTGVRAFARIWEGVSVNIWDKEDVEQVSATVQQVLERVPVYHLACTPDESAVSALEQMLRKQVLL